MVDVAGRWSRRKMGKNVGRMVHRTVLEIARKVEGQAGSKVGRWKTGFGYGRWEIGRRRLERQAVVGSASRSFKREP